MGKSTQNLIIGIGLVSILFSVFMLIRGRDFMDTLVELIVGITLIGKA